MAEPQPSAPPRAPSAVPRGGVVHVTARHTERFTVVGNHLAQHRELSLTAIGPAVHIQSLPDGARVDIRTLAARFAEGETRIAAALRELEAHGYLSRKRERLPSGRVVTRTVSYDNPAAVRAEQVRPSRPSVRLPEPRPAPAPAVAAWLERGAAPDAVRRTLAAGLPAEPLRHPAALLAHRLTALLPPHLPATPPAASRPPRPDPLRNCDGCDRAFRSPPPGLCRDCRDCREAGADPPLLAA
ncbi:helix-turn-helix domain-containing protein [Streptomyces sp. S1A]|uniref:helix-turn-helix domain-containing protein n=1 Tax=Streptomyces sp. ICN903 TaxID=2964654 RepID=UPI001EDC8AF3|nr:helix-turn-helix domain-containing protein [Streptomyces sp. ICN903]MCG3040966.1 helix-turn-helix domain-containing protein [Streptomyces sp. ICN903]